MNSQNSNTLNPNSFMHFSERVYGNPNDWLSKKDNHIYSKSIILLTFTLSFWILSDVARLLEHPLYCVLFAYGSVIFFWKYNQMYFSFNVLFPVCMLFC